MKCFFALILFSPGARSIIDQIAGKTSKTSNLNIKVRPPRTLDVKSALLEVSNMPMSTECLPRSGRRVTVMEALSLHDQERRKLLCIECRHPVNTTFRCKKYRSSRPFRAF
jgi:hypothetical protein